MISFNKLKLLSGILVLRSSVEVLDFPFLVIVINTTCIIIRVSPPF